MIQVSAEGTTTWRVIASREAPSTRAFASRLRSTSRTPWKALKNTTKNTRTEASDTFEAMPRPSATVNSEPSTIRGIAFATLI